MHYIECITPGLLRYPLIYRPTQVHACTHIQAHAGPCMHSHTGPRRSMHALTYRLMQACRHSHTGPCKHACTHIQAHASMHALTVVLSIHRETWSTLQVPGSGSVRESTLRLLKATTAKLKKENHCFIDLSSQFPLQEKIHHEKNR